MTVASVLLYKFTYLFGINESMIWYTAFYKKYRPWSQHMC